MKRTVFLFLLLVTFALSGFSQCLVTLQPGPSTGKDARLMGLSCYSAYPVTTGGPCDTTNLSTFDQISAVAWTWMNIPGVQRSLLEFDLDSLAQAGCSVSNATLILQGTNNANAWHCGQYSTAHPCVDNSFRISRVTSAWQENTVTWATQPTVINNTPGLDYVEHGYISNLYDSVHIDLTAMVNYWLANPTQNHGMQLALNVENMPYQAIRFASSNHANPALRPMLILELTCPNSLQQYPHWCGL